MSVEKRQSNPKLMVIGLDAATYDLIEPWVQQGLLPTFASLMSTGAYGPLKSVPNLNSASAWSSFATGQNPGKHGIFWFYERQTNSYEFRYHRGTDNTEPRFWEIFSNAGRSVAILNVPLSYPAAPLNGIMITGMLTPSTTAAGFTYPDTLRREIASIVPEYQIESDIVVLARSGRWDQAIQSLEKVAMARVRLAEYLLQRNSWDLFVTVFTALDRVQHVFWRHMSPNHPGYDPDISPRYQNTVLEFYQLLDQAIDKLLQHCDKDTYVVSF
jgi:predicted AlkP superfamily phosphohydrolase/phosphomutase